MLSIFLRMWPVDTSLSQGAHLWSASIAVVLAFFCLSLGPLCLHLIKFNSSLLLIKEGLFQWPEEEVDTTGMWPLAPGASVQRILASRPSSTFQRHILSILIEAELSTAPWPVLQRVEKREVSENGDTQACFLENKCNLQTLFLGVCTLLISSPAMSTGRNKCVFNSCTH